MQINRAVQLIRFCRYVAVENAYREACLCILEVGFVLLAHCTCVSPSMAET
jgi:hypothetical protein